MNPIMTDAEKITSVVPKPSSKRQTKKEKELFRDKVNQENMAAAIATLENINRNHHSEVNRNIKNRIAELVLLLKDRDEKFSLSVRAANAISILDRLTQDKGMKSHIRTMLWQVVSNLEGIRE
ncbi:MAG: UPF0147 family protein [Nitrososphaeraceae archaeon]|jgi:uncharacterized protein